MHDMYSAGPPVGTFDGEPIAEWIHLTDGRVLLYEGTIRQGEPFTLEPDVFVVANALLYREDPQRRTPPAAELKALVARGEALQLQREPILDFARRCYAGDPRVEVDAKAGLVPDLDGGAWVSVAVQVAATEPEVALEVAKALFEVAGGSLVIQHDPPPRRGSDGRWRVPAVTFVSKQQLGSLH